MSDPAVTPKPTEGPQSQSQSNGPPALPELRRRWACDRCHAQKLRCLRTINPQEGDCDRCVRVAAKCGYSPPGKMGRPSRSETSTSTPTTTGNKRARASSTARLNSSPVILTTSDSTQCEKPVDPSFDVPLDDFLGEYHRNDVRDTNVIPFLHDPTQFGLFGESGFLAESNLQGQESHTDNHVRELINLTGSQYEQSRVVERARERSGLDKESLFKRLQGYPVAHMFEHAQKLTGLVEALLETSSPQESTTAVYWSEMVGPLDLGREMALDVEAPPSLSSNPSSDESIFVDFDAWADLPVPKPSPTMNNTQSGSGLGRARADTSTTLLVLSCYIRLSRLYLLFFADLHCFLLASHFPDPVTNNDRRLFPGLKLGSFQPFAGTGLEISMVVQVSEVMLSRLHRALGLSKYASETAAGRFPASSWNAMEMITPVLMQAVQAQEGLDAQDAGDKGNTCTQLSLAMDGVKRLLRARAFL
ncbi:hypothetical protein BDV95DRAFT_599321 [Massariosphaeria phaeospora]|uniref:Zn(2)-C6 fungal-type domain-containing protein n=1 Tax=Massariosphaeria phaeospora TaxID=100035 RepID=A0A7C8I0N3_9PLEO|nr:hypothetical protein BDV95DRAFT_599321 [Massariosphaeria phaeospora]